MIKANIAKESQREARVFSAALFGGREDKRWIVQEDQKGGALEWLGGTAQPVLLEESKGYVRPAAHRTVQRAAYDQAPIHRVEIWRDVRKSAFHVRIFEQLNAPVTVVP